MEINPARIQIILDSFSGSFDSAKPNFVNKIVFHAFILPWRDRSVKPELNRIFFLYMLDV